MYYTKLFAILVLLSLSLCSGAFQTKESGLQNNNEFINARDTTDTAATISASKMCPAGSRWAPGPGTSWQWQLSGTVDTSFNVQVYDIDMFGSSQTLIDSLHMKKRAVICYIDTAYEPDRPDSNQFTAAVLGKGIDGWPGQKWVDIRSPIVRQIMVNRIAKAANKKCDGVEMDDVDAYTNDSGFPLTAADQLDFNRFLAKAAHNYDLSIALKNDVGQITSLVNDFDYAVNEQCYAYNECSGYANFIKQGKAVFGVEYDLATNQFCSQANAANFNWLKKGQDLDASMTQCCTSCSGSFSCTPTVTSTLSMTPAEIASESLEEGSNEGLDASEEDSEDSEDGSHGKHRSSSASQVSGFAFIAVLAAFVALL